MFSITPIHVMMHKEPNFWYVEVELMTVAWGDLTKQRRSLFKFDKVRGKRPEIHLLFIKINTGR